MKILIVGNYFYPVVGGVEIHMKNLATELGRRGHQVRVLTSNKTLQGDKLPSNGKKEKIPIKRVSNIFSLLKEIRDSNCDIIHFHFYSYGRIFVPFGIIVGNFTKKKLVFTPHCIYPGRSFIVKIIKRFYDLTLGRFILTHVDAIISLTENDKRDVITIGADPRKIKIVPNSIRLERFSELGAPNLFRKKLNVEKFLLYVGRIDWNKGLEHVIRIMPILREFGLKFVIIGENMGSKNDLEELARKLNVEKDIVFSGYVSFSELSSAYATCTLFILPSQYEGLPTVVLEAMAYKKIVIAAQTGGTKYVIKNGYNGFLFNYGDLRDMRAKIQEALNSDLTVLGENARKTVEEDYAWRKSIEKIEKIYMDILRSKN